MKKLCTTFAIVFCILTINAQFTWLNKNPLPAVNYWGMGFSVNGNGYLVGGGPFYSSSYSIFTNNVWEYNPTADTWTQKSNFPNIVGNGISFTIGNDAYVLGGWEGNGSQYNNLYKYDAVNDVWMSKSPYPLSGLSGGFGFVINGIAYAGGGSSSGQSSTSVYAYDSSLNSWSSKASYPGPANVNGIGFAIDSFGYAGLGSNTSGTPYQVIYKYDPSADSWSTIAPFPGLPRVSPTAFVINGKAYVGGGWTLAVGGCVSDLGDFYEYDPVANTWTGVPGIPGTPRDASPCFSINNTAYIWGGYSNMIDSVLSSVYEFGACNDLATALPPSPPANSVGVQLYPNPAAQQINVKIDDEAGGQFRYKVVSVDGKVVFTGSTPQRNFTINTNNLEEAVYLLQIINNNGEQAIKRFEVIH